MSSRDVDIGRNGGQPGYHLPNGVGGVDGEGAPAVVQAAGDSRIVLADKKKFFFDMVRTCRSGGSLRVLRHLTFGRGRERMRGAVS